MTAPTLPTLDSGETQEVLSAALREVHGPDARLDRWTADARFTEHGKQRVVRYDLQARLAGSREVQHDQWVGKFYDRDEDARRVAAVLGRWPSAMAAPAVACACRGSSRITSRVVSCC